MARPQQQLPARMRYQHAVETVVLCASACACMSAVHACRPLGWGVYAWGAVVLSVMLILPLRFARMLAPVPYGTSVVGGTRNVPCVRGA
jgi:hypothetical protein